MGSTFAGAAASYPAWVSTLASNRLIQPLRVVPDENIPIQRLASKTALAKVPRRQIDNVHHPHSLPPQHLLSPPSASPQNAYRQPRPSPSHPPPGGARED